MPLDIGQELRSPMLDEDWLKKVIIGGILSMIPIVNFVVYGYVLRRFKMAMMGEAQLPEWEGWGEMFVLGLKYIVVSIVYMIIPLLVLLVMVVSSGVGTHGLGAPEVWSPSAMIAPVFVVYLVLSAVFFFFVPMASARLAATSSMGEAVRFGDIYRRIRMVFGDYLTGYVVLIVIMLAASLVGLIPFVGWVLTVFVSFYVLLVLASIFGKLYALTEPAPAPSSE